MVQKCGTRLVLAVKWMIRSNARRF